MDPDRLATLETEVAALRVDLDDLKTALKSFKERFE